MAANARVMAQSPRDLVMALLPQPMPTALLSHNARPLNGRARIAAHHRLAALRIAITMGKPRIPTRQTAACAIAKMGGQDLIVQFLQFAWLRWTVQDMAPQKTRTAQTVASANAMERGLPMHGQARIVLSLLLVLLPPTVPGMATLTTWTRRMTAFVNAIQVTPASTVTFLHHAAHTLTAALMGALLTWTKLMAAFVNAHMNTQVKTAVFRHLVSPPFTATGMERQTTWTKLTAAIACAMVQGHQTLGLETTALFHLHAVQKPTALAMDRQWTRTRLTAVIATASQLRTAMVLGVAMTAPFRQNAAAKRIAADTGRRPISTAKMDASAFATSILLDCGLAKTARSHRRASLATATTMARPKTRTKLTDAIATAWMAGVETRVPYHLPAVPLMIAVAMAPPRTWTALMDAFAIATRQAHQMVGPEKIAPFHLPVLPRPIALGTEKPRTTTRPMVASARATELELPMNGQARIVPSLLLVRPIQIAAGMV
jgi:hypothetical protein